LSGNSISEISMTTKAQSKLALLIGMLFISSVCLGKDVYPDDLSNFRSLELGGAVLMIMPDKGSDGQVGWGLLSEGPIEWLDDGYVSAKDIENGSAWIRRGLIRVNVLGSTSTILLKRKHELAWSIIYRNYGNPGFGVASITLEPGTPDKMCFFSNTDGCVFDPVPSLKKQGIEVEKICEPNAYVQGYRLSHPKKNIGYMRVEETSGSGGATTSVTLWMGDNDSACAQSEWFIDR